MLLGCDRDEAIDLIDKASKIDTDNDDIHPVNTIDNGAGAIAQAEKYAVYQLQYDRGGGNGEETISIYGISPDSRYWKGLDVGDGRVVFGGGLLDKFGWSEGQKVTLSDKYEGEYYSLEYAGKDCAWGSKSDMNIYMSIDDFNELFGNDAAYFNGYVSNEKLNLDARYFAGDTTPDDMRAVGDQFIGMMSKMIGMMVGLAVFIFLLFMYLLTKAVIDHSARSISYMKVFGYRDSEISHLYIRSITLCVAASLVLSLPVIIGSLTAIFRSMLLAYNGNIEIYVPCVVHGGVRQALALRPTWSWHCCTRAPSSASAWPKPSKCRSSHRGQSLPFVGSPAGWQGLSLTAGRRKSVPCDWSFKNVPND